MISFISLKVGGGGGSYTSIYSRGICLMGYFGGEEFIPEAFYYPGLS
jgi:hypothetical protein